MAKKYRYRTRTFLNADQTTRAYVIAYVQKSEDDRTYSDVHLEIGDCTRQINLDFDFRAEKESIRAVKKKLKLFRGIIADFADAVEKEIAFMESKMKSTKSNPGIRD